MFKLGSNHRKLLKNVYSKLRSFLALKIEQIKKLCTQTPKLLKLLPYLIESSGKTIIWGVSIVIFAIALTGAVKDSLHKNIYIEPVDLPEEILKSGLTPINFAESSIRNVQKLIDSQKTNDTSYIDKLIKNNKFGSEFCESPLISKKYINEIANTINFYIYPNSGNVEIITPETGFSLNKVSDFLQQFIGNSRIQLKASIIKIDSENGFLVRVSAKYNSKYSHESELPAKTIRQAEDILSLLLLKYANPAIYASLMFTYDPLGAEEGLLLAIEHLPEYNKISSPYTLLGYLNLTSNKQAQRPLNYSNAKKFFEQAIRKNNKDSLAQLGIVILNRDLVDADILKKQSRKKIDQQDTNTLDTLISKGLYLREAYLFKALINDQNGEDEKTIEVYKKALKALPNEPSIVAGYINYLISKNKINEAKKYTEYAFSEYWKKGILDFNLISWQLWYSQILLLAHEDKFEEANVYSHLLNKCGMSLWGQNLQFLSQKEKDPNRKNLLQKYANIQMAMGERNGLDGFQFYNSWGVLLSDMKRYDDAILKFNKALEYPGDDAWALLNIASALNEQGKFKEAETYSKRSLSVPVIPQAVANYLSTILNQQDYEKFLGVYEIWQTELLPGDKKLEFLINSGQAQCIWG